MANITFLGKDLTAEEQIQKKAAQARGRASQKAAAYAAAKGREQEKAQAVSMSKSSPLPTFIKNTSSNLSGFLVLGVLGVGIYMAVK